MVTDIPQGMRQDLIGRASEASVSHVQVDSVDRPPPSVQAMTLPPVGGTAAAEGADRDQQICVLTHFDLEFPSVDITISDAKRGRSMRIELSGRAALTLARALQFGGTWVADQEDTLRRAEQEA